MTLTKRDHIVTAWAECAGGPGWGNSLVWVLVRSGNGKLRIEAIQPEEQSDDMRILHQISDTVSSAMTAVVRRWRR